MPTTSGGMNFTYPNEVATGWNSIMVTAFNLMSAHDHTGAPDGVQIDTAAIANLAVETAQLGAYAVTEAKFRSTNNAFIVGRNNADDGNINILKVNASDEIEFGTAATTIPTLSSTTISATGFDGAFAVGVTGGWVSNLGITYASNTLSIAGADGTALSASNPGYVIMQDKSSPGLLKKYTITANQGFIDDTGASEIVGNLFGLTTSVAYAADIPFYIYAVTNDAENAIAFMISRVPHATVSPAAANIGAPDDAVADAQGDFFSFDNLDETLYDANPCIMIGSFRMQMSASDDWTIQTLSASDGIGQFNDKTLFDIVTGHFGGTAGKFIADNGGTGPTFTTQTYKYKVNHLTGECTCHIYCTGNTATDGAGAVASLLVLPYVNDAGTGSYVVTGYAEIEYNATRYIGMIEPVNSQSHAYLVTTASLALPNIVTNASFTDANRSIRGAITFNIEL
jgi:hypothetical protein